MAGHHTQTTATATIAKLASAARSAQPTRDFTVWAPHATAHVQVVVDGTTHDLATRADGTWEGAIPAPVGARYGYLIDGYGPFPDPRSAHQPDGPLGLSAVVDHSEFAWNDHGWTGFELRGAALYELHIGTFTPAGTFDAAIGRLDHLVDLGIDAVQLLPVASFPGTHGWGYDVVCPFAVHEAYGGPDAFKRFVDACHARGLGVILDVVYNHLGPGCYQWANFGPYFATDHTTDWGPALNLDGPGSDHIRRYLLDNAAAWVRDFHVDGLRLDAVHTLRDARAVPLVPGLVSSMKELGQELGRPVYVIAESDANDPRVITSVEQGGLGLDAQWADDVHHALHVALTGETQGYYTDFSARDAAAAVLRTPFLLAGSYSQYRQRSHGAPLHPGAVPGSRFIASLQNHDQVGNRVRGERLSHLVSLDRLLCGVTLLLTSAFTPMLWMGEEWAASSPWLFFAEVDDEQAQAVKQGRVRLYDDHGHGDVAENEVVLDRRDASVLAWDEVHNGHHARVLSWYRTLLRLRRDHPDLRGDDLSAVQVRCFGHVVIVGRGNFRIMVNLGADSTSAVLPVGCQLIASSNPAITPVSVGDGGPRVILPSNTSVVIGPA